MSDTTATIAAKGCNSTGITEELAVRLHDQLGKKVMAVVELEAAARTENTDGKQKVQLRILTIEPATDRLAEDHLREFQRALHYNRKVDENGAELPLDGNDEPTVEQVRGHGAALLERDQTGEVIGLWDGRHDDDPDADEDADEDPDDEPARRTIPDPFNPTA